MGGCFWGLWGSPFMTLGNKVFFSISCSRPLLLYDDLFQYNKTETLYAGHTTGSSNTWSTFNYSMSPYVHQFKPYLTTFLGCVAAPNKYKLVIDNLGTCLDRYNTVIPVPCSRKGYKWPATRIVCHLLLVNF